MRVASRPVRVRPITLQPIAATKKGDMAPARASTAPASASASASRGATVEALTLPKVETGGRDHVVAAAPKRDAWLSDSDNFCPKRLLVQAHTTPSNDRELLTACQAAARLLDAEPGMVEVTESSLVGPSFFRETSAETPELAPVTPTRRRLYRCSTPGSVAPSKAVMLPPLDNGQRYGECLACPCCKARAELSSSTRPAPSVTSRSVPSAAGRVFTLPAVAHASSRELEALLSGRRRSLSASVGAARSEIHAKAGRCQRSPGHRATKDLGDEDIQRWVKSLEGDDALAAAIETLRCCIAAGTGPLADRRESSSLSPRTTVTKVSERPQSHGSQPSPSHDDARQKLQMALDILEGRPSPRSIVSRHSSRRSTMRDEEAKQEIAQAQYLDEETKDFLSMFAGEGGHKKRRKTFREAARTVRIALMWKNVLAQRQSADEEGEAADKLVKALGFRMDADLSAELDKVRSYNEFDVFKVDELSEHNALKCVGYVVLQARGLMDHFHLSAVKMGNFLEEIQKAYLQNPYHNAIHGADVTQTAHSMLLAASPQSFSELQVLTALFSAVCHDVGHLGLTNGFRMAVRDEGALTYNDRSINENMHCTIAYRILTNENCNWTEALSDKQEQAVRKSFIQSVLATDMAAHFENLKAFKNMVLEKGDDVSMWESHDPALEWFVHAADISSVTKRFDVAERWTPRVLQEFFEQGDRERTLGLPISPLCDRHTVSQVASQCGFVDFIVKPTFEALAQISNMDTPLENLDLYITEYKRRLAEEKAREKRNKE